jgi:phosphate uptake regulator
LPADVRDASDRLNPEMKEAVVAFQTRDPDLEQKLQSLEDSVGVIEKYLGK